MDAKTKLELAEILWRIASLIEQGQSVAYALNTVAAEVQQQAMKDGETT